MRRSSLSSSEYFNETLTLLQKFFHAQKGSAKLARNRRRFSRNRTANRTWKLTTSSSWLTVGRTPSKMPSRFVQTAIARLIMANPSVTGQPEMQRYAQLLDALRALLGCTETTMRRTAWSIQQ